MSNNSFASISNTIIPVSYFVNHAKQLENIKNNLDKYRQTSIVGISGMGKTQIARMYAYENKNNYHITWFFDCNLDINSQFVALAKELNQKFKANISEDTSSAKKSIMDYLGSKDRWLLVFDNLKIGCNKRVQEFVDWEHNGHIIFCSQDSEKLPYTVVVNLFRKSDAIALASNILENKDSKDIEFLSSSFKGYPILTIQGAQLINKVKGLNKEEYKTRIQESSDKIKLNIELAIKELNQSATQLLYKISLINNQLFSKNLLNIITDSKNTIDDDIYQLSKFALISNVDPEEQNPIFEMHDVIAGKVLEMNHKLQNKKILSDIASRFIEAIPSSLQEGHIFRTSKTIHQNLEVISSNATKYDMSVNKLMELNEIILVNYINTFNYDMTKALVDWFNDIEAKNGFNLLLMNKYEKYIYSRYLITLGSYYRLIVKDYNKAISYFVRAKQILENSSIEGHYAKKHNLLYQMASSQIALGMLQEAEVSIEELESMLILGLVEKSNNSVMYLAKARLFNAKGDSLHALEEVNKDISESTKYGLKKDDLLFTPTYLLKAEILNHLGRYSDSINQIESLINMHKSKKEDHVIFGSIFTQMAIAELGLGKVKKASEHIIKAIAILLADAHRNSSNANYNANYSEDTNLATAYTVQGDIFSSQNKLKEAIEVYRNAQGIYFHLYKDRTKNIAYVSNLYIKGAKAACKTKDLFYYKCFGKPQIEEFGINHPNTVAMLEYCKNYDINLWDKDKKKLIHKYSK